MKAENKHIVVGLLRASAEIEAQLGECLKPLHLSLPQFNVLRILRGQKRKVVTLNEVQKHMIKKMSNTSRLIDKLIEKKMVSREVCSQNRRSVDICITPKGLEVLEQLDPVIHNTEAKLTKNLLPKEKQEVLQLLDKFLAP